MDSSQMLPVSTIVSMWAGLVSTVLLPVAAVIFWGIRKRGSFISSFAGILSYAVSFGVYGIIWCIYVALFSDGYNTVGLTWDYYFVLAVLNGIAATLFNYLFLQKCCKKEDRPGKAFSFYAGYAAVVCFQSALTQAKDLYWAMRYNRSEGLEALTGSLSTETAQRVTDQLYNISMFGTMYFLKVLETVLYLVCYMTIGYLMYQLVKKENRWSKWWLTLLAVLQFGIVLPAQLIKSECIEVSEMEMMLGFVTAFALIFAGIVYMKHRRKQEEA